MDRTYYGFRNDPPEPGPYAVFCRDCGDEIEDYEYPLCRDCVRERERACIDRHGGFDEE